MGWLVTLCDMATIRDVAADAGVARSTVSYVLSGKKKLPQATIDRVLASVAKLNYRPDPAARALALRRTNILGLLASVSIDTPEADVDVFGPHAEHPLREAAVEHDRTVGAGDDGAAAAGFETQQVHRRRPYEARNERVRRILVEVDRLAILLDAARAHQHDAIGHRHRLDLVVRHVHHRDAELALQRADLDAHLGAQLRVEVRQWLVHQANGRLRDDRAPERDPLLLTARQLAGLAAETDFPWRGRGAFRRSPAQPSDSRPATPSEPDTRPA